MLERVQASLTALPPAEQRVAKLLLAQPRSFASLPVAELATKARVSKPTVVRFCRSVGYEGLADFKRKLAGAVDEGVPFVHRAVSADDKASELVVKVVDNAVAALLRYRKAAEPAALERAIAALALAGEQARRIEFYGVGNSGIVAQDAQHKFFRLGVSAHALNDGHTQVMSATMLAVGDCAVVISNSGRSKELMDVAELAHGQGATVLAICASGSPLARWALGLGGQRGSAAVTNSPARKAGATAPVHATRAILLAADHPEDADRYSPMVSRLLHLAIVDVLTTGVALRLGAQRLTPVLKAIKQNLRQRRYIDAA